MEANVGLLRPKIYRGLNCTNVGFLIFGEVTVRYAVRGENTRNSAEVNRMTRWHWRTPRVVGM